MKTTRCDPEPLPHEPPEDHRRAQEERLLKAWETPKGWRYWSAVNNTEVGLWYTATAFLFFLFGGALALLIRVQLAVPGNEFLSAEFYNQVFTVHGSVMMFLFAIPMFEAIAVIFLRRCLEHAICLFPDSPRLATGASCSEGFFFAARSFSMPPRAVAGSCIRP